MSPGRYLVGQISWYGVLIVFGMLLAILLASREEKRLGLPKDTVLDLALWLLPFGIIGARIYYVVFSWSTFSDNPFSVLYIWQGGMAIYGGIIGGLAAAALFSARRKLSLLLLLDMVAPGVALAQAIGRWGNFFNSEAYGAAVTNPAWQFFPVAVLIPGEGWHQATFFYESAWDFLVFVLLWLSRKKKQRTGDTFLGYVLFYGAGRLVIEGLRTDSLWSFTGTIRVSQALSFIMCFAVCALLLFRLWRAGSSMPLRLFSLLLLAALALCAILPGAGSLPRCLLYAGLSIAIGVLFDHLLRRSASGG